MTIHLYTKILSSFLENSPRWPIRLRKNIFYRAHHVNAYFICTFPQSLLSLLEQSCCFFLGATCFVPSQTMMKSYYLPVPKIPPIESSQETRSLVNSENFQKNVVKNHKHIWTWLYWLLNCCFFFFKLCQHLLCIGNPSVVRVRETLMLHRIPIPDLLL